MTNDGIEQERSYQVATLIVMNRWQHRYGACRDRCRVEMVFGLKTVSSAK